MPLSCRRYSILHAPNLISIVLLFYLFTQPSAAQEGMFSYSPGAKAVGIGHTGVVGIYDASALYWNPASLSITRSPQGFLSIHEPFAMNYLGYSHFFPRFGSCAFSFFSTYADSTPVHAVNLGWGYQFTSSFSVGLNIGGFEHDDLRWSAFGFGFLLRPTSSISRPYRRGTIMRSPYIADRLTLGLTMQNIPLGRQFYEHEIRAGLSYKILQNGPALIYAQHFMPSLASQHFGLLITPAPRVQVYAGLENFDMRNYAFGGSFEWDNVDMHLSYDALTKRLVFSTAVRIGLTPARQADAYYDKALDALRQRDKKETLRQCEYALVYNANHKKAFDLKKRLIPLIEKENVKIDSLLVAAQSFLSQENYLSAAAQYLKIIKIDAQNHEAKNAIEMIRPLVNIDVERWYQQAVQAYNDGNMSRALELFESIVLVRPEHFGSKSYLKKIQDYQAKMAEQLYYAGLGFYSQRKLDLAETEFEKALAISPNYEDAAEYLQRIRKERTENRARIAALSQEAQQLENSQAWAGALEKYQEILKIQPDHANALRHARDLESRLATTAERYYSQGKTAYDSGNTQQALQLFNQALSLSPNHAGALRYKNSITSSKNGRSRRYIDRAQAFMSAQNWQMAIVMADSAMFISPTNQEAAAIKTRATNMLDVETLMRQGRAAYLSKSYLNAIEFFDAVLAKDPEYSEAQKLRESCQLELNAQVDELFNRGIQLYTEEKYRDAINMWNTVLRINPYHKGALDYKARAQERLDVLENLP